MRPRVLGSVVLRFWVLGATLAATIAVSAQTPKTTKDKIYSKDQAAQGEQMYGSTCAKCHDPAKVPAGKKPAPALIGDAFLDKWNGRTLGELMTNIETTMPNDGSAVLTSDDTANVVAYILQANKFADGTAPLKPGAASKDITIVK